MAVEIAANVLIVELGVSYTTPFIVNLDPGTYTLRATYPVTGQVLEKTTTITSGVTTAEDFYFAAPPEYWYITIASAPSGWGSTVPSGSISVVAGELLAVTAVPASASYEFDYWESDIAAVNGSTSPNIVVPAQVAGSSHTLTAHFRSAVVYTLNIATTTGGTTDPAPGTYTYPEGMTVKVTAKPDVGLYFAYWVLDGGVRYENPIDVIMDKDQITLQAVFSTEVPPPPPPAIPMELVAAGLGLAAATGLGLLLAHLAGLI